ncbi:hypothetical protein DKG75_01920 [Zavarzinia compransoris]|uniref:Uncharacterized protein n=1 Tax=Zavarzinia compransoris TaxID=1264899 RepID=A0A317E880_9PROT|nr:hypothetical protein DKG75_01920 [Zavarzinia compransoris]
MGTGTVDAALAAKQPLAALLTAIASLATAAGKGLYFAGIGAPATYDLSSFVRGLSGVGDAAGLRTAIAAAGTEGPEISSPLTVKSGTYPEIRIATTVDGTPDQRAFKIIIDHPRRLLAIQATSDFGSYIRNIIQFGHDGQISAAGDISISKPPGTNRSFSIYSDGIPRWSVSANSGSEGGGNTGSDFGINRFSDNGDYLGTSMFIDRGTGLITMSGGLTSDGPVRYRVYTRGTLPTPAAFTVGWAQVSNPESGKSLFVYCNGTAWVYIDGSAVTIA